MFETLKKEVFKFTSFGLSIGLIITLFLWKKDTIKFTNDMKQKQILISQQLNEIKDLNLDIAYSSVNLSTCKSTLSSVNNTISKMKVNEKKSNRIAELENEKLLKLINSLKEVSSNECEDIKNSLDIISDIEYNSL